MTREYPNLRKKIIVACQEMVEEGLVVGTWGNISISPGATQGLLITQWLGLLFNKNGGPGAGRSEGNIPSDTANLLRSSYAPTNYKNRDDIKAIVHSHSPCQRPMCCPKGNSPLLEDLVQIVGGGVDVTPWLDAGTSSWEKLPARPAPRSLPSFWPTMDQWPWRSLPEAMTVARVVEKAAKV